LVLALAFILANLLTKKIIGPINSQSTPGGKAAREFTANVSHELKTPLTSILGYAELMRSGMVQPEDQAAFAGRIYDEARHLLRLVEDMINLSRLDEREVLFPVEAIDLFALVREVVDRLAPLAAEKQIRLASAPGEGTTVTVIFKRTGL